MAPPFPELIGSDLVVPLATGGTCRYLNLDAAASTPAMRVAADAVQRALPWYSSVHRGAGFASQVSTRLYETARQAVADFVGARESDTVIFVRNTTEALNLAARCLPIAPGHVVLSTAVEHHANMLPWRRMAPVIHLQPPPSRDALLAAIRQALEDRRRPVAIVAITGASNVTGEVFPIAEVAALAHEHDAVVVVDAAQLAPHRDIDMAEQEIDCIALSGHKMYAPFGSGALVAPRRLVEHTEPMLAGGGAVDFVTLDDVVWTGLPDRLEAGSPNVLGAVALAAAAATLSDVGMENVADHERQLLDNLDGRLRGIPGLTRYRLWDTDDADRVGVYTFTVASMHHALVAAVLSAEHGIGVRHGCFCAHPYITHLLGIPPKEAEVIRDHMRRGERASIPGAVRASFSIAATIDDIDRFAGAVADIVANGPRLDYVQDPSTGDFTPATDSRTLPRIQPLAPLESGAHGGGCGRF